MRITFLILIFTMSVVQVWSQNPQVLSYTEFIRNVYNNHPLIYQARLLEQQGEAYALKAKGVFDPVIDYRFQSKSFDKKDYYDLNEGQLSIPTWLGADFKVGYENNSGEFLNNENILPESGLIKAGIQLPLGRGLFYNDRQKVIQEAKLLQEANQLKREQLLNKTFNQAAKAFLQWQTSYTKIKIQEEAVKIAGERFDNTKTAFEQGDIPAIDTLEALINLRSRRETLLKFNQNFTKSIFELNNFLWLESMVPMKLLPDITPDSISDKLWSDLVQNAAINMLQELDSNPFILNFEVQEQLLEIEKRITKEYLKPEINLNYFPLLKLDEGNPFSNYTTDNYQLGVDFSYPLFTRNAKADIKLIDIDIEQNELESVLTKERFTNMISNLMLQENLIETKLNLLENNVRDSKALLEVEKEKLSIGESSIFLINARETQFLKVQHQLIETTKDLLNNRLNIMLTVQINDFDTLN